MRRLWLVHKIVRSGFSKGKSKKHTFIIHTLHSPPMFSAINMMHSYNYVIGCFPAMVHLAQIGSG